MAGDFLKDFYYRMEEKYYAVLDRIDKVIPVYKIVEPIDKVVPSFAIVLLIIILLILFGGWFLLNILVAKPLVSITLKVETSEGDLLGNATATILGKSYITDSQGLARLELEKDLKVRYEISKRDYETKKGEFLTDKSQVIEIIMVEERRGSSSKTITIQDFYGRVITKSANFSFTCTSGATPNPPSATTSSGSVSVNAPSNCGILVANVDVQGFEAVQSRSITESSQIIQMQELAVELSRIRARVLSDGAPVAGITVTIFENTLGPLEEQTTNSAGIAEFSYAASSFQLKTRPTSEFGQQSTEEFETSPGETVTKEIILERDITAILKVNVTEKTTGKKIANAAVTVRRGNSRIDAKNTDANGTASFTLNALDSNYFISADHPDYLVAEKRISITEQGERTESLILEKFTGSNAATLRVKVLDAETGKPVKAARVALYYGIDEGDNGGFLAPYAEQLSDINGIARFPRVRPGISYYAVASRMGASGMSDTQRLDAKTADTQFYNVSLIIPSGTVRVVLRDDEGFPISNAKVTLYDAVDNSVLGSDLSDFNGTWTLPASSRHAKADKEVFVRVEKNALTPDEKEYAAVTTIAKPILPNTVTTFSIIMQPKEVSGDFKLEFLGLFKKDKRVQNVSENAMPAVSAGQEYVARFRAIVPEGQTYTDSIIHVHVGKGEFGYGIMEKDSAVLKEVNMPFARNIIKATKLDSADGFDEDVASITEGDAKWANIPVSPMYPGIYEMEVSLEVKSTALVGEQIGVYYWMLGDSENGRVYFPRIEKEPKDDFYFEPPAKQVYQVGVTTLCDSEFCFNASIIEQLDNAMGLGESVDESYSAKILKNYKLIFNISNNSKTTVHNDAELRIANDDESINIKSYSITLPSSRTVHATLGASELPNIPITNSANENRFEKGAAITGELLFTPTKANNGIISFKIASSSDPAHTGLYSIVFQKDITIIVSAENQFNVEVTEPASQILSAGIENTVTLKVKDSKTGLEVSDADVVVKDRFGNALNSGKTSRLGEVTLRVAALLPNEEVTFTVSKPDYVPKSLKLKASDQLLKLTPESLSVNINATIESQKLAALKIENIASFPLKIESLTYVGDSKNIIDDTAVNNYLSDQQGFELSAGSAKSINFGAFLTQEAIALQEREQLEGTLIIKAGNFGYTWTFNVPVKTTVGFGADLDNEDCLVVTPLNWTTTTQGKAVSFEFEVQNNCSSNGKPIPISELSAKLDWQSNQLGDFTIALYDDKIQGAVSAAQLRSGYFKKLIDVMEAEKTYKGVLAFNPAGGVNGIAAVKIVLRAKNQTSENEAKPQLLTQEILANISVINLKECISFSKELLTITKGSSAVPTGATDGTSAGTASGTANISTGESSDSFTITNKKDCGEIKLSMDVEPKNTLTLSQTEITLADGATSAAINVIASKNTMPGQYAIRVWAQPKGQATPQEFTSLREKDKFLRVRVWDSGLCLQLDKYEFDVYKDPENKGTTGYDTGELTNYCVEKEAKFKVDMTSFMNAAKDGAKWGLLTALLGLIAQKADKWLAGGTDAEKAQAAQQALMQQAQGSMYASQAINTAYDTTKTAANNVNAETSTACDALYNAEKAYGKPNDYKKPQGCITAANFASSATPAIPTTGGGTGTPAQPASTTATITEYSNGIEVKSPGGNPQTVTIACPKGDTSCTAESLNKRKTEAATACNIDFKTQTVPPAQPAATAPGEATPLPPEVIPQPPTEPIGPHSQLPPNVPVKTADQIKNTPNWKTNLDYPNAYKYEGQSLTLDNYSDPAALYYDPQIDSFKVYYGGDQELWIAQNEVKQGTTTTAGNTLAGEQILTNDDAYANAYQNMKAKASNPEALKTYINELVNNTSIPASVQAKPELRVISFAEPGPPNLSDTEYATDGSHLGNAMNDTSKARECVNALATQCDTYAYMCAFDQKVAEARLRVLNIQMNTSLAGFTQLDSSITKLKENTTAAISSKTGASQAQSSALQGVMKYGPKPAIVYIDEASSRTLLSGSIEKNLPAKLAELEPEITATKEVLKSQIKEYEETSFSAPASAASLHALVAKLRTNQVILKDKKETIMKKSKTTLGDSSAAAATTSIDQAGNWYAFGSRTLDRPGASIPKGSAETVMAIAFTSNSNMQSAVTAMNGAKQAAALQAQSQPQQAQQAGQNCPNGICPVNQQGQPQAGMPLQPGQPNPQQGQQQGGLFNQLGVGNFIAPGSPNFAGGILGGSPITQGLGVFLAKTMYNMSQQDVIEFTTTQHDLEVTGFEMYLPKGEEITDDSQISVEQIGNYTITDNRIGSKLSNETMGLRFTNNNPQKYGTFYKTLEINAIRHYYEEKTYNIEDVPTKKRSGCPIFSSILAPPTESDIQADEIDLDEENGSPSDASQFFLLQFNNINPEDIVKDTVPTVDVDCVDYLPPGVTGTTGEQAFDEGGAPRLLLDWSWPGIERNSCDEGNPNYAFCDGVQFSIEVLRKVQLIREFLATNKLECPSGANAIGEKTNVIADESIGIARLYSDVVASSGNADVNVQITIENKIPSKVDAKLTVTVTNSNTAQSLPACVKDLNVVSKTEVGCEFKGLLKDNTAYTVVAALEPSCGTACDKISADNIVESSFIVSQSPLLQQCEPFNTSRLADFINATEKAGKPVSFPEGISKEEFLKNINFNSYLVSDRYSPDLQSDFDDYYRNIALLQTPAFYRGEADDPGLGIIFKDYSMFRFGPKYGEPPEIGYLLPKPGLYNVSIEIDFKNSDWKFFENGQADVEVLVRLNKAPTQPASLSPFYYLPFDGRVGVDNGNGRTNYGLNYEQQFEGAPVQLTTGLDGVALSGGASWIPYSENATLKTDKVSDFKKLNVDDRGQILTVSKSKLAFSPSYATPAILKVSNKSGEACASYSFGAGSLTYAGQKSNPWWGVGESCKDFYDSIMIEAYQNGEFDKSTQTTGSWGTRCGSSQYTAYGMEWPEEQQQFGNVFLKSIFYTPQGTNNVLNIEIASDSAEFWTKAASGTTNIPLNGVGASADSIADIKQIIDLVKARQVCVSGTEVEQKFWWNPTAVINEIADLEKKAESQCIKE